jgi:hypothetical protein
MIRSVLSWQDAFRIAAMVVAGVGGIGAVIVAVAKFVADIFSDRIKASYQRDTDTMIAELRGRLDEGVSRLNAALQHQNFVLQRLAEIELNGIHSCWRAAITGQHLVNGLRPVDCGNDPDALRDRLRELGNAHNTLLTLIGKYDPFTDQGVGVILHEIARILRQEISQARREPFTSEWWDQGDRNRAALETQVNGLRAAVQLRIAALRQLADDAHRSPAGTR